MNRYLEKVAQLLSEENKQVGKTFALQSAAALPAHALGGYLGNIAGKKYGKAGVGTFIGTTLAGGLADLGALKASLHGKVKEK